MRHAHYAVPVFGRFPRPPVLMGKQGTDIFGSQNVDTATEVQNVMRHLMRKPPGIQTVRSDIKDVPVDRVHEALDRVNAFAKNGGGPKDSYETFKRNLAKKRAARWNADDDLDFLASIERMNGE